MSLSQETLLELMSLADGELQGEAKERAERLVAESEEARRALDGFRAPHVGLWLSEHLERRGAAAGAGAIADAVMGALSGEVPAAATAVRVVKIDEARPRRSPRRGILFTSVLGVTAVAAGIALFVSSTGKPAGDRMPVASVGMPSVDMQPPPTEPSGAATGPGVEVDEVDSPSRGISVFEIPLARAAASVGAAGRTGSSVVVWIDDEASK